MTVNLCQIQLLWFRKPQQLKTISENVGRGQNAINFQLPVSSKIIKFQQSFCCCYRSIYVERMEWKAFETVKQRRPWRTLNKYKNHPHKEKVQQDMPKEFIAPATGKEISRETWHPWRNFVSGTEGREVWCLWVSGEKNQKKEKKCVL